MILNNATIAIDHLEYSNLTFDYAESNDEINVLVVGDTETIIETYTYIHENEIKGKISVIGMDATGEEHSFELKNPNKLQFNLSRPYSISISCKK